ncbi:MAG TPA: hypothetical protein VJ724_01835 [Tahibacter sp.]|nr:hypothetical protein [Tahibacter sp.]
MQFDVVETRIAVRGVQSLAWQGDALVDWVGGGVRYELDGNVTPSYVRYAYVFDASVALPDGEYAVIHTRLGTKGLLLRNGRIVREINRSYYQADSYDYPVALMRLASGRVVLAHCPDAYNRLELEDAETGERLTASSSREPTDFFHSRLTVSPDGRYLMSAGWIWHPVDCMHVYDIAQALADPSHLDGSGVGTADSAESGTATFLHDGRLLMALVEVDVDDERNTSPPGTTILRTYADAASKTPAVLDVPRVFGDLMPVGAGHVLALYEHPRLVELATGNEVASWPHVASGNRTGAISHHVDVPPAALDAAGGRYAVADADGITVLQFNPASTIAT